MIQIPIDVLRKLLKIEGLEVIKCDALLSLPLFVVINRVPNEVNTLAYFLDSRSLSVIDVLKIKPKETLLGIFSRTEEDKVDEIYMIKYIWISPPSHETHLLSYHKVIIEKQEDTYTLVNIPYD